MRATATDYITLIPEAPVLLISGRWDVNKEYTRDSEVLPLVEHEGLFYSLNKEGMTKGGLNPKDDYAKNGSKATWKLQNSYEMVIVKALVAGGGLVGEFVFWDGKMMSQQGVDKAGNPSTKYEEFRTGNFIPNLVFDALTGDVIALKGRFGMFYIDGSDIVGKTAGGAEVMRITGEQIPDASVLNGKGNSLFQPEYDTLNETFDYDEDEIRPSKVYQGSWDYDFNCDKVGQYKIFDITSSYIIRNPTPGLEGKTKLNVIVRGPRGTVQDVMLGSYGTVEFYASVPGHYNAECFIEIAFSSNIHVNHDRRTPIAIFSGFTAFEYKATPANTTLIGNDGLYTSFSSEEFLHYKAGEGFEIRADRFGLKISKSGIQKWNGNQWVAANI